MDKRWTKEWTEEEISFFAAMGFSVVTWASAEHSLDLVCALIFRKYGGNAQAPRLPKQLEVKLTFLEKCLDAIPRLKKFRREGRNLTKRFKRVAKKRHDLMHGSVANLGLPKRGDGYRFHKFDYGRQDFRIRRFKFSPSDFEALSDKLMRLDTEATVYLGKVVDDLAGRSAKSRPPHRPPRRQNPAKAKGTH